jgi:hypothetical protein
MCRIWPVQEDVELRGGSVRLLVHGGETEIGNVTRLEAKTVRFSLQAEQFWNHRNVVEGL